MLNSPVFAVGSTAMFMRHNNKRLVFQLADHEDNDILMGPFTFAQIVVAIQCAMKEESGTVVLPNDFRSRDLMRQSIEQSGPVRDDHI